MKDSKEYFLKDKSQFIGFKGDKDAGKYIPNRYDATTGIPIISLYGKNKKPSKNDMQNIDVLVFDLQDVGVRFYTYLSTLHYVLEACAENDIQVLVLDLSLIHI